MSTSIVLKQVRTISEYCDITDEYKIDRIRYGLEIFYCETSKIIILLLISYYMNFLDCFFLLIILLMSRSLLGGSHCKTYFSCLITTITLVISLPLISKSIVNIDIMIEIISLVLLSIIALFKQDTTNNSRPKRSKQYRYFEKFLAIFILITTFIVTNIFFDYYLSNCTFFTSILILLDYILYKNWRN